MSEAVGILGGCFDPPHIGHLVLADGLGESCALDRVLLVPAHAPPHREAPRASYDDRLAMVTAAVAGHPLLSASDVERDLPTPSFSLRTVEALARQMPDARLVWLMGADAAASLPTWHRVDELLARVEVAVAARPGTPDPLAALDERLRARVRLLDTPQLEVSSSMLRARLAAGRSVRYLVPDAVREVIAARGLYPP